LAQVAKHANVSVTTASLALSNKGRISDDVRERVKQTAEALAYTPRAKRRSRSGVSAVLGFIDQEWSYSWSMQLAVLRGITKQLAAAPGNRSACVVPVEASDSSEQIIARIKAVQADSVFSIHYADRELILGLEDEEIPVIIIMNNEFQTEFTSVCVDDFHGAYDACNVLVQAGHKRIAYISAELPMLSGLRVDRLLGFQKCLTEHGLSCPPAYQPVVHVHAQREVDLAVERLMSADPPPTACFVMDDYLGVAVLESARRLGFSVPEDLSIICAGDVLDYGEPYVPQLSTLSIPFDYMGATAVGLLDRHVAAQQPRHEVLKVNQVYVDRGSVAPRRA